MLKVPWLSKPIKVLLAASAVSAPAGPNRLFPKGWEQQNPFHCLVSQKP